MYCENKQARKLFECQLLHVQPALGVQPPLPNYSTIQVFYFLKHLFYNSQALSLIRLSSSGLSSTAP